MESACEPKPDDLGEFTEMAVKTFDECYRRYLVSMDTEENG